MAIRYTWDVCVLPVTDRCQCWSVWKLWKDPSSGKFWNYQMWVHKKRVNMEWHPSQDTLATCMWEGTLSGGACLVADPRPEEWQWKKPVLWSDRKEVGFGLEDSWSILIWVSSLLANNIYGASLALEVELECPKISIKTWKWNVAPGGTVADGLSLATQCCVDGYRDRTQVLREVGFALICSTHSQKWVKHWDDTWFLQPQLGVFLVKSVWCSVLSLMERFHSTCSAKHDDSALESVSKALNQGLKVWMLYDNVGSLARTCRNFAGHRKRRDFFSKGGIPSESNPTIWKMRFVDALRCVGGPRFSTGLTASRTKRFGGAASLSHVVPEGWVGYCICSVVLWHWKNSDLLRCFHGIGHGRWVGGKQVRELIWH